MKSFQVFLTKWFNPFSSIHKMKYKILSCLVVIMMISCHHADSSKTLTDNGSTLTIKVDVHNEKQSIEYNQSFDVANMNDAEKKELVKHIYDSLGVSE